jgi:hypothetical protein
MKNKIISILQNNPKLESAIVTFISFFLLDLGMQIQTLASQPLSTLTWGIVWGVVVAAARSAAKEIWVWYRTPKA